MKRKPFFAALLSALLATTLLGCGGTRDLQSITLTIGGNGGTFNLQGVGGTLQLKATGNYSNSKTIDITNRVTYAVVPQGTDVFGNALPAPPMTVTMSPTGLLTAVEPFTCTWENLEQDPAKDEAWVIDGSYMITATVDGVTSQPVFVAVASAAGLGPPVGACGPSTK